jgi:hypothetical protein
MRVARTELDDFPIRNISFCPVLQLHGLTNGMTSNHLEVRSHPNALAVLVRRGTGSVDT